MGRSLSAPGRSAESPAQALKRTVKLGLRLVTKGWYTEGRLRRDLEALGVNSGRVLLVHSSLSSLGVVSGGAETVIDALLAVVGPDGTLVMPSHTWDRPGRGDFAFDIDKTPSCVGAISEKFRTRPGTVRSLHPTHSVVALGAKARDLIAGHDAAKTPCGEATPYARMIEERAQILFLGTTLDQNTMFHTLEAYAGSPYLLRDEDEAFSITDASGSTQTMRFRRHERGPDRRFAAVAPLLETAGILRKGRVGASQSLLVECAEMAELVSARIREDSTFLVQHLAR
jgi:aminoglycoside 3-N-acetyltransferase